MIDGRVFSAPNSEGRCTVVEDDDTLVICKVDDAMRIMLIGRGYLARRESYPRIQPRQSQQAHANEQTSTSRARFWRVRCNGSCVTMSLMVSLGHHHVQQYP
jgi:hypothetical protein